MAAHDVVFFEPCDAEGANPLNLLESLRSIHLTHGLPRLAVQQLQLHTQRAVG